jgi:hypothetical protein
MLQSSLDYETRNSYSVLVRAWDGGAIGAGNYADAWYGINVLNENERPSIIGADSATLIGGPFDFGDGNSRSLYSVSFQTYDPDGDPVTVTDNGASLGTGNAAQYQTWSYTYWNDEYYSTFRVSDNHGAYQDYAVHFWGDAYGGGGSMEWASPVVLDLDGNGIDLLSASASPIWFDMDNDGYRDRTGWVGANDGILAIDRDGDGLITKGEEISFTSDVGGAVSDLEGLRAYDTNQNGLIDAGDQKFSEMRVWQDANQNGVCDSGELTSLLDRGISAINVSLMPTGATTDGASDNVVYGTTQYVKTDGSTGTVGDVALKYNHNEMVVKIGDIEKHYHVDPVTNKLVEETNSPAPAQLAPIVLDLNGDGVVSLQSRVSSQVTFDMDDNGVRQKTGWVGAGDGLLVLDRDGDGKITKGSEISFKNDLPGATSDLEGLRAYDTNQNGLFDAGDAKFAQFRIWQDANQDGVCGSNELKTLADYAIKGINLTRNVTGQTAEGASDNVIVATANVLHTDGSLSTAGDVFLSYDAGPTPPKPLTAAERTAFLVRAKQESAPKAGLFDVPRAVVRAPDGDGNTPETLGADNGSGPLSQPEDNSAREDAFQTSLAADHAAGVQSALDTGLSVLNRNVLQMVSAMSTFNSTAPGQLEIGGRKHRPEGTEYLTALPELRSGNSLHAA